MGRTPLLAMCCLALAVVVSGASPLPKQHEAGEHDGAAQKAIAESLRDIAAALEKGITPDPENAECAPGRDDRKSDLCAQWKAADAAERSSNWTERTFWLGVVGTLIGGATLVAAGMAAKYARDAAIHTQRSADFADRMVQEAANATDATREAMRLTEKNGKLQVRAYAGISPIDILLQSVPAEAEHVSMTVVVGVRISNSGASPAYNVRVGARLKQVPWPFKLAEEKEALPSEEPPLRVVAAGETSEDIRLTQKVGLSLEELRNGKRRFYIGICLMYEDVFGDTHRSEYHGLARPESLLFFLNPQRSGVAQKIEWEAIPGSAVAT